MNWKSSGSIGVNPLAVKLNTINKPPLRQGPWIVLPWGDQLAFPALSP